MISVLNDTIVRPHSEKRKKRNWNRNCEEVHLDDDPSGNDVVEDRLETLGVEDCRVALEYNDNWVAQCSNGGKSTRRVVVPEEEEEEEEIFNIFKHIY